jgi:hypothetical protein
MNTALPFLVLAPIFLTARADLLPRDALAGVKESTEVKSVYAVLARDSKSEPTTHFSGDTPKIETFWKGHRLDAGDRIHAIWIAEDVGPVAPKASKVTEVSIIAYKSDEEGAFSLARPKEGWPVGNYRLEIYLNGKLTQIVRFSIDKGVTVDIGRARNWKSDAVDSLGVRHLGADTVLRSVSLTRPFSGFEPDAKRSYRCSVAGWLNRAWKLLFPKAMPNIQLTGREACVVRAIGFNESILGAEIQDYTHLESETVTDTINSLLAAGFIESIPYSEEVQLDQMPVTMFEINPSYVHELRQVLARR